MVFDGKEREEYLEGIYDGSLCFSEHGERLAYIVKEGSEAFVVVDWIEQEKLKRHHELEDANTTIQGLRAKQAELEQAIEEERAELKTHNRAMEL